MVVQYSNIASQIERLIDQVGKVASWATLAIVGLISVNVLLRYTFSVGSVWSQELEWHLLAVMILFGMSYSLLRGENVRVDLFYAKFSPEKKFVVDVVSALLTILVSLILIKLSFAYVMQSYSIGEGSPDPGGIPGRWVIKSLIPIGFFFVALQAFSGLIRIILKRQAEKVEQHV